MSKKKIESLTKLDSNMSDEIKLKKEDIVLEDLLYIHKPCIEIVEDLVGGILLSYFINEYVTRHPQNKSLLWLRIDTSFLQSKLCLTPKQVKNAIEILKSKKLIKTMVLEDVLYVIVAVNYLEKLMLNTDSVKNYLDSRQPKIDHEDDYHCYIMSRSYMEEPSLEYWLSLPFNSSWLKYFSKKEGIDMRLYYMVVNNIENISNEDLVSAGLLELLVIADKVEFLDYWIVFDINSAMFQWYKEEIEIDSTNNPFETLKDKNFIQIKEGYYTDLGLELLYVKINREQIGKQLKLISQLPEKEIMSVLKELYSLINNPKDNDYQIN